MQSAIVSLVVELRRGLMDFSSMIWGLIGNLTIQGLFLRTFIETGVSPSTFHSN